MAIAAAETMAAMAEEHCVSEDCILPTMDAWEIFPREAAAVAVKAQEQGVARLQTTFDEEYKRAAEIIQHAREMTHLLMREGAIPPAPDAD
jgi:malate dehydrogenase (oxaloacetate-decarboxylating)